MNFLQCHRSLKTVMHFLVFLFVMSASCLSYAQKMTVQTDRQTVEMGDVITLMIEADFQSKTGQLSLKPLEDQFDILNQQQSNQVEIINGSYNAYTRWRVQLLPKQIGKLIIPPFELEGAKSDPYPITVLKAQYSDNNRPYFLEAKVDKNKAYVQEQVVYTLKFFHKGSLLSGNIRPPKFDDALVEQLKEQSVYGKTINGQQYTVYEWQYAFYPQSSGQLIIPGPSFTGMLQLRGGQKGVRAIAEPVSIEVLPKQAKEGIYWLPASSVKLSQKWVNLPQTVHVGDSIRRIITLEVEGLKVSQLPEIKSQNGPNYKIYPDTADQKQSVTSDGIKSTVTLSQAVVPSSKGTLQLEDITIHWWNTVSKKMESAVLKTAPLEIWPASSSIPKVVQSSDGTDKIANLNDTVSDDSAKQGSSKMQTVASQPQPSLWMVLALVMTLLWLITMAILYTLRRKLMTLENQSNSTNQASETKEKLVFNKQWCDLPLNEFYRELLRQLRDDMHIEGVEHIPNEHLKQAVLQLESHLFGGQKLGYKTMQEICDNWAALISKQNQAPSKPTKKELADLYNKN